MKAVALKLVLRSWWRNKTFSIISIISLAIGIGCTNLLAVFVIHEFNIEGENANKSRIYLISQDSPMKTGERTSFAFNTIPPIIKEKYPEVADYLRIDKKVVKYIAIDEVQYEPINLIIADASLSRFFPYETRYGNLDEALSEPNKIALTETTAQRFFGKANPIGKTVTVSLPEDKPATDGQATDKHTYQVAAVIKERSQSFLNFDALTSFDQSDPYYGSPTFFMTNKPIDPEAFALQLKKDKVPTIQGDMGRYYFSTLQDSYFHDESLVNQPFFNHRQPVLLYVGLASALLILLIACFNYINLNFSRLLQQVRMIHTQKLMGAESGEINRQLFIDTFLTVMVAFLLSLLIMHDLLPVFNSIVSGKLRAGFFFNWQALPVIGCFILLLSIIPAVYMSRKIGQLSGSDFRTLFTGSKKKRIITSLSIAQYAISIGLIIATLTVNDQIRFIRQGGDHYKNLIEIGNWKEDASYVRPFVRELKSRPETGTVSIAGSSILNGWVMQMVVKDEKGNETYFPQINYLGESDLLDALQIKILRGLTPEKALETLPRPVYINEKYADILIPKGEDPIGKPLSAYDNSSGEGNTGSDPDNAPQTTIAGIIENMYTHSLEREVCPITININNSEQNAFSYIYIRLGDDPEKSLATIRQVWEKTNPGKYFTYRDVYEEFLSRSKKTTELSHLLLMYSLISIFLTCFGLFGMALYAIRQRTKEIGIRKINGANTLQILLLLNRQFIGWIGIAFVLAVPLSWLWLHKWLEGFVYRTDMSVGYFLLAGLFTLVVTLLTVSWHSYRAASGNPVESLKAE